jgi:hypothetical protein
MGNVSFMSLKNKDLNKLPLECWTLGGYSQNF